MITASSAVQSNNISHPDVSQNPHPSKLKTYGFVVAIIVGIGGLAVVGVGLASYFHVGGLSKLAQIDAIIMMAAGGGAILLIGIVSTIKNRQGARHQQRGVNVGIERGDSTSKSDSAKSAENSGSTNPLELVYGPDKWPEFGKKLKCQLEILDENIPEIPKMSSNNNDKVILYIPQKIKVNGVEKKCTLNTLIEIVGVGDDCLIYYCTQSIKDQFGDMTASGWIEIDKSVISESRNQNYEAQEKMVDARNCRMPSVLEAVIVNLMVFALTEKRLYTEEPYFRTYTRCFEKVKMKVGKFFHYSPILVGSFGLESLVFKKNGLFIKDTDYVHPEYGVMAVRDL